MTQYVINKVKNCAHCKKYEGAPPIAKLQKLPCSGPGELLHIDFTMIEETVGLHEEPVIRNVLVMQDHFSKHVMAYVVKDKKARTAAEALGSGYFGLFRAPAYLLSDKGKSFTAMVVEDLCKVWCKEAQNFLISHSNQWTSGVYEPNTDPFDRQVGQRQKSPLVKAPAGAADGIQFHALGGDWVQSPLPAFWQEAEDTSRLHVSNLVRYTSQV